MLGYERGVTESPDRESASRADEYTRNFLQSEAERIERETARYMNLTQMASASVKIIFDTVSGWRQAGHPMREFEITRYGIKIGRPLTELRGILSKVPVLPASPDTRKKWRTRE